MLKYLLPSVSLILYSETVYAACGSDCKIPPTCSQMGYRQDISCPEGFITCPFDSSYKWCKEYTCADGRYQNAPLSAQEGYSCSSVNYHGHTCYDCTCAPQAGKCKYNAANKGTGGVLSSPCCNGNYNTCISSCGSTYTVSRPANSYIVNTCTACGTTYYNWKCKSGYLKNAAGTACDADSCDGYTLDGCPSNVVCSECVSGTTTKYKATGCAVGYTTDVETCGTTGSKGWMLKDSGSPTDGAGLGTDWVDECGKCTENLCMGTAAVCSTLCRGILRKCYRGDEQVCVCVEEILPTLCDPGCLYNCSNCGGSSCSSSPTRGSIGGIECRCYSCVIHNY